MSRSHPLPGTPAALSRPVARAVRPARAFAPRWISALLRARLAVKLFGANLLIAIAALAATVGMHGDAPGGLRMVMVIVVALATSLVANLALVNVHLDSMASDRAKMRQLAAEIIRTGDNVRAALGRELHDSTAQSLAALVMQLSAIASESDDPALATRLDVLRGTASDVLEDVRLLAQKVHPRVLADLGLAAALANLARGVSTQSGIDVVVDATVGRDAIPPAAAAVLYRVAEEAVHNAARHGAPARIGIRLFVEDDDIVLRVGDDGCGFDLEDSESDGPGLGIFTMRQRVALAGGHFEIMTSPGAGATVHASLPLRLDRTMEGTT